MRQRLQSISTPEDLIKVTQEIDSKRGNYEAEIMKKIFRKRNLMDEDGRIIDDSKKIMYFFKKISI